jgi:hypothetical protein
MTPDQRLTAAIGIVGTVLTAGGLVSSYFQYRAADFQAQAAIAALMPQVQVRALLEKVDSDKYTAQRLEITSDGGPVYNFHADRVTWFQAGQGKQLLFERPLIGYFLENHPTGQIKGELQLTTAYKNHEKYLAFARGIESALGGGVDVSRPKTLLRLSYTNVLKNSEIDYFLVDGGTTRRLALDEGERMWQDRKKTFGGVVPFDLDSARNPEALADLAASIKKRIK